MKGNWAYCLDSIATLCCRLNLLQLILFFVFVDPRQSSKHSLCREGDERQRRCEWQSVWSLHQRLRLKNSFWKWGYFLISFSKLSGLILSKIILLNIFIELDTLYFSGFRGRRKGWLGQRRTCRRSDPSLGTNRRISKPASPWSSARLHTRLRDAETRFFNRKDFRQILPCSRRELIFLHYLFIYNFSFHLRQDNFSQ